MYDLQITKEQIEYAKELVEKNNFGLRSKDVDGTDSNGNKTQQLTGILGQTIFADASGLPRPKITTKGWDGGKDFIIYNKSVDIKTMHRTVEVRPEFTNNFVASQIGYDCEYYIFASLLENKDKKYSKLTICGIASKDDIKNKGRYYPKGTVRKMTNGVEFPLRFSMYEIDMDKITDVKDYEDLKKKIKKDAFNKEIGGEIKYQKINEYGEGMTLEEEKYLSKNHPYLSQLVNAYKTIHKEENNIAKIVRILANDKTKENEAKEWLIEKIRNTSIKIE